MTWSIKKIAGFAPLHFFLAGAVIYSVVPEERPRIVVSDPSQIDEEVLIHEALRLGLLDDSVVSRRLARIGRFVADHQCEDAEDAEAMARELGLDREDLVVRRYLVEMMKLAIAAESDRVLPSEAELEAHLEDHAERFRQPEQIELAHVFVSSRRGRQMHEHAETLRRELVDRNPATSEGLGDPFTRPHKVTASLPELERIFGPEFSDGLDLDGVGSWQGPVQSGHGIHWVWVEQRIPARLPEVAEIRGQVVHHHRRVKREEHVRRRLAGLRTRYEIVTQSEDG